ncbi:podocalyxin isoform 2-T2 [Menidia menidia]
MRATQRITGLLFSLSFLLDGIHSFNTDSNVTIATLFSNNTAGVTTTIPNGLSTDDRTGRPTTIAPTTVGTTVKELANPATTVTMSSIAPPVTTMTSKKDLITSQVTTDTNNKHISTSSAGGPNSTLKQGVLSTTITSIPVSTTQTTITVSANNPVSNMTPTESLQGDHFQSNSSTIKSNSVNGIKVTTDPTHTSLTEGTTTDYASSRSMTSQRDEKTVPTTTQTRSPSLTSTPSVQPETITSIQSKAGPTTAEPADSKGGTTSLSNINTSITTLPTEAQLNIFSYSLQSGQENQSEDKVTLCKQLMQNWTNGTCLLTWTLHNGKVKFIHVEIKGTVDPSHANKYYQDITKKTTTDNKTLIAILASCGALLIMIVILAVCASHHRKPYNENQHLTEELHTVENGYHDNPTLEVMEVQPEMQEKKMVLNGEFNDSWIVPIDNLMKEDIPDEEDTHL